MVSIYFATSNSIFDRQKNTATTTDDCDDVDGGKVAKWLKNFGHFFVILIYSQFFFSCVFILVHIDLYTFHGKFVYATEMYVQSAHIQWPCEWLHAIFDTILAGFSLHLLYLTIRIYYHWPEWRCHRKLNSFDQRWLRLWRQNQSNLVFVDYFVGQCFSLTTEAMHSICSGFDSTPFLGVMETISAATALTSNKSQSLLPVTLARMVHSKPTVVSQKTMKFIYYSFISNYVLWTTTKKICFDVLPLSLSLCTLRFHPQLTGAILLLLSLLFRAIIWYVYNFQNRIKQRYV